MGKVNLRPGEWGVRGPVEFEVPYGMPPELAFPPEESACFKGVEGGIGRLHPYRRSSCERVVRPMQGVIAILPRGGVFSDRLKTIVLKLPVLAGYTAADVYELAAWVKRVERRKLAPDILFAPWTFTRTARGDTDVLCYVKALRRCEFYNVSEGSLTSDYHPAMISGNDADYLFKSHMTAGVLCTKPLNA